MLILKARQEGISTWVGGRIYLGCKLHLGRKGMVLADKLDRTGTIFDIYDRFERESPELIARPKITSQKQKELAWEGDSWLRVGTAQDRDAGRGDTLWYVHASEFAFWPYPAETLMGLLNATPQNGGEVYIESTANGLGGEFHSMWEAAEAGENGWVAVFLPWWAHDEYRVVIDDAERAEIEASADEWERAAQDEGFYWRGERHLLTPEQLAFRRRKIADDFAGDERRWRQEYPATAEEAFIATGGAFFDEHGLSVLTEQTRASRPERRVFVAGRLQGAERGPLRVYEWPSEFGHYVIGADTAQGKLVAATGDESERGGRDFSCADVLKVATWELHGERWVLVPCREQVAQWHGRMSPDIFAEGIRALGMLYGCRVSIDDRDERAPALVVVERNHSSGQSTIRWLRDRGYPALYRQRGRNVVADGKPTVAYGFLTDQGSRRMVLDHYAALVREGTSGIRSPETVREMRTFVLDDAGKPQAQEGAHDDRVLSYALALEAERWHTHGAVTTDRGVRTANTPTGL